MLDYGIIKVGRVSTTVLYVAYYLGDPYPSRCEYDEVVIEKDLLEEYYRNEGANVYKEIYIIVEIVTELNVELD